MIDVNLNLYRNFYAVAKAKTINEASKKLNISQPAVSKNIKNLENILNVKLFYRNKKGIELTPEGNELFENIDKAYNYIISGQKMIEDMNSMVKGSLTIGIPSHITCFYLVKYLKQFTDKYPNIKIRLISSSTTTLTKKLYEHEIDFIIDSPPIHLNYEDVRMKKLKELDTTFISNTKIAQLLNNKNIDKYKFILPYNTSPMTIELKKVLKQKNLTITPIYEVDTTDVIISTVKNEIGIGYVVKDAVKEELNKNELFEVKMDFNPPKLQLNLVYIKNYLTRASKVFIKDFLVDKVGDR